MVTEHLKVQFTWKPGVVLVCLDCRTCCKPDDPSAKTCQAARHDIMYAMDPSHVD